jgi:hypothetical protein
MSTGKWTEEGVPHRGWSCVDCYDNDGEMQTCQMCEVAEIRYVHVMQHPDYDGELEVGCVCAEHMEEDYANPRERERRVRNEGKRRARFLMSSQWLTSANGNSYIVVRGGWHVVVFQVGAVWSGRITEIDTQRSWPARQRYPTEQAAKLGAFQGLDALRKRRSQS